MSIMNDKFMPCNAESVKKCIEFIQNTDMLNLPKGSYPVCGEDIFCVIQEYTSQDLEDCKWEAHKKYVDVQYIISGSEQIGIGVDKNSYGEYEEEKDFVPCSSDGSRFAVLTAGEGIAIDVMVPHMPKVKDGENAPVKKAIFKIKAELYHA